MTAGRLTADRLVARFGPASLLRICGLLAGGGFAAGALTGIPLAAVAGFGFLGADRKSTRLNSSHLVISYAVFCLKKKKKHSYCSLPKLKVQTCHYERILYNKYDVSDCCIR